MLSIFSYTNNNTTPVYIPIGENNNLSFAGAHSGKQPELFMPGTGYFDIYSNALPVTWTVKSYQYGANITERAVASSSSPICGMPGITAKNVAPAKAENIISNTPALNIYPNPVKDRVTIHAGNALIDQKQISLFDVTGRKLPVKILSSSNGEVTLNASQLRPGVYTITLKINNSYHSFRILKE